MGNFKERQNFVTFVTRKRADEYRIEERISFYFFLFKKGGLLFKCRVLVDNV